ncbi:hypothetical protein RB653_000611 [Dictyostelium firmibasis]|uniref:Uncharacterized protein n=1 Tax=Dictyostelium firmibasis TaxID=79012 RepID=A0AAN7U774_9MYCE
MATKDKSQKKEDKIEKEKSINNTKKVIENKKKTEENTKIVETSTTVSNTKKKEKSKKVEENSTTTEPKTKKVEEISTPKTKKGEITKAEKSKKVEEAKTVAKKPKKVEEKKNIPKEKTITETTTTNKKNNEKVEQPKKPQPQQQQQQQQKQKQQKRKLEEIESSSESEEDLGYVPDSSDDSDDDSDFEEIQADFDIVPSVDKDYHSIKNMIVRLVPYNESSKFNAGELTELIIEQATKKKFGRSINIDGSEDPYGFVSILNYQLVKNQPTIQGYIDYINEKLQQPEDTFINSKLANGEKSMKSYLSKLLTQSKTNQLGLIFSERFINIPSQLAHPIYQFMQFDVELMQEKHNDSNYDFKNYLVFTSFGVTAKPNEEDQLPPKSMNTNNDDDSCNEDEQPIKKSKSNKGIVNKKEKKTQKVKEPQVQEEEEVEEGLVLYQKCEDKYFKEYATAWATYDIPYLYGKGSKWTLYSNMIKKGLIMIVPATKYQQFLNDLKEKAIFD